MFPRIRSKALPVALTVLALVAIVATVQVHRTESQLRTLRADEAELTDIRYGLFNVDEWRTLLADIVTKKLRELEITDSNRQVLEAEIEGVLRSLLDEFEIALQQDEGTPWWKRAVRRGTFRIFDTLYDFRDKVPELSQQIVAYLEDPENRERLRDLIIARFEEFADTTFGRTDMTDFDAVLADYDAASADQARETIDRRAGALEGRRDRATMWLAVSWIGLISLLFARPPTRYGLTLMLTAALVLLVAGVSLPMIDIEATIEEFAFTLASEPVRFAEQTLFYQSKSIVEVVTLLLARRELALGLVAILIFSFSVAIPTAKMIASLAAVLNDSLPKHRFVRFLVTTSGKWSMADVMVVALFMAYIGFNGVINAQLGQIDEVGSQVEVLTTNKSALRVGFYLFTGYTLAGLLLSTLLERRQRARAERGAA